MTHWLRPLHLLVLLLLLLLLVLLRPAAATYWCPRGNISRTYVRTGNILHLFDDFDSRTAQASHCL